MIAVDWGTSSLRAYRLGRGGELLDRRSAAAGLLACQGRFEAVLATQLQGWDDPLIVMAGMIGSRNGWHEVPYVDGAAGAPQIAAGMVELAAPAFAGRRLFIAPGLSRQGEGAAPEVMRGEETQILGLLETLPAGATHRLCLPGTHSKWAVAEQGRITGFCTAMTGELYAVLRQHSLLGALMQPDAEDDAAAFERGLAAAHAAGGLLHHLFGVRTLGLFGMLGAAQAPSYLSGLLIGHELDALAPAQGAVHLIGGADLTRRYARALQGRGLQVAVHPDTLSARGLHRLARERQLVD